MNNQPGNRTSRLIWTLIICALSVFAGFVSPTSATEASGPLQLTGRWAAGVTYAVAARDKYAFIGNGANLDIVNFSNSTFQKLENRIVLPSVVRDLALTDKFLYVANLKGGLRIIELADYATAKEVGFLTSANQALDVAVRDTLAFLAEGAGGLRIINVKNPTAPVNLAVYPSLAARGVAVSGNYVYLADGGYGLKIINITDPANPRLTGQYTTVDDVRDVTVSENRAYLANGNSGLLILSVLNPANPIRLGSLDTDGFAEEVEINRNFALIADTNDGLRVVNIFNPASPSLVKTIDKGGQTLDIGFAGDLIYLSTYYDGVYALNIANPANPTDAGYYQTAAQSFNIAIEENYAYIANNWHGLVVLDISNPAAPIELSRFNTKSWTNDLVVKKNLVYLSDSQDGLVILDVSNSNQPEQIGHFPTSNAQGIALQDTLLFITDGARSGTIPGLWIINIRDPKNPIKISFLEMYDPLDVAIQGNYAYVADGKRGFKVVDFSAPANPREIAFYNTGNSASGVAVQQNYAFVTDLNSGLRVVDISDPNKPKGAGSFDQLKRAWDIAVYGKYAAVADNELGLVLLDISTPTNPVLVENFPTGHQANNALFHNDFLYLTDWEDGVYIFNLETGNLAPESPTLVSPANNAFLPASLTRLLWNVPADADNDLLHFNVELSTNSDFTAHLNGSPFRSRQNSANFMPTPPLLAGSGTAQFTLSDKLNEGTYYWRVSAEDAELVSAPASPFHFTIDTTPPFTANHFPAKGAVGVIPNTPIQIQIQDLLSGVNATSLILKIDGTPVTPNLTGTAENFTLSYQSATPFLNSSVVTATLDASDQVGNIMATDTLQFTIVAELNLSPGVPVLVTPENNAYFQTTPAQLVWNIPADANNDLLHFTVELSSISDFSVHLPGSPFRSQENPANFTPTPPVTAGSGTARLALTENLNEGIYYWRVSAQDDESTSVPAAAFQFAIDTTPPFTSNHFPAKNAANVAATTEIRIQIQDLLSGVNAASLNLKINGAPVAPVRTGSAENYTLSYQPATPFPNSSVVTVTLDASDQVGNLMATDTLQFTVDAEPNQPPAVPVLLAPANRQFVKTTLPEFSWQVPVDVNGDSLHFRLEISKNQTWEAPEFQIESRLNSAGFSPVTPQSPGEGEVSYLSQSEMPEGVWWWRVAAWDGQVYSAYSEPRQLIVDVTPPVTSNHQPSKNAVGVDIATRISFYLQDALSGVDSSTITLKINGAQVIPVLSGNSDQFIITFTPANPFVFEQLVVVNINAADSAGNSLATEEYSFITASEDNTAPGAPMALHPGNRKFLNLAQPRLCWTVPPDLNGDSIHFKVEINNNANWAELFFSQDSRTQPEGFSPVLPVPAGADSVCYQVQPILAEGPWWWRVAAWDGAVFGSYSGELQFTIDQTSPVTANHNPSRAAEGVPIDTKISFNLTDLRSGVNPASIQLRINDSLVTPSLTGDSSNFLIAFTPASMFNYEDTIRISIDANDWVANPMPTDSYYFITASEANTAPQAPEITAPVAGSFLRVQQPVISWNAPADLNGDKLHFKVELDQDHDWATSTLVFESAGNATGFSPKPPVIPGSGEMTFQIPEPLAEGEWWFRVAAWDGIVYSSFSGEEYFLIDLTAPVLFSRSPAANSTEVAINTNIEIILKDALSGIKHASIRLKINDTEVIPSISGNPNEYRLTFNPLADFGYEQRVTISVAAEDLAGNVMPPVAYAFTTTAAQNTLTATLEAPGTPEYHKPFAIQARLASQRTNLTGVIYYRAGGSKNYFPILMSRQSGDLFSGTIPANEVTERGLEFYLYAADNSGAVRTVPEGAPASAPHRLRTYITEKTFPATTPALVYRLITVPIDLTDGQPDAVLTDDLAAYDRNKWRLFQRQQNTYQEYTFSDFLNFTPGRGFWLITRESRQLDAGPGYSVRTDTNFVVQLQSGWNLIGNPFSFPVSWDSVVQHGRTELPVAFGGNQNSAQGFRYQQTVLNAWEGYAVKNLETSPISIEFKPIEAVQSFSKPAPGQKLSPGEWQLQLAVRCENAEDTDNFVGQIENAATDWDEHDFSEVPPIGEFVSLYFPHSDWQQHPGNYAADFRAPTATGDYWDFSVVTNFTQGEIRLETSLLQELPPQWQIYLVDKKANRQLELGSVDQYVFPAQNNDFRLIIGTAEVIENNIPSTPVPVTYCLLPNYPNPFNPGTTIRYTLPVAARVELVIYNLMGQKIKTLVSAAQSAGQYEINWDGKNSQNEAVPSGIYWYQIRANAFTFTRKMVLAR